MKKIILSILSIFIFGCCGHASNYEPTTHNTVHQSVGRITVYKHVETNGKDKYTEEGYASGFSISSSEIMTANHVCESLDTPGRVLRLSYHNGIHEVHFDNNLTPIKRDYSKDLCILFMYNNPLKPIPFSTHWPKMGDEIFLFGPVGNKPYTLTSGFYGQNLMLNLQGGKRVWSASLSTAAFPGNSGSPVLNDRGEFIGMLISGNTAYHHIAFTPAYIDIKSFLEDREK